jgi:hypothetical protein
VCDQETSKTRRLKPAGGLWKIQPQWVVTPGKQTNSVLRKERDVKVFENRVLRECLAHVRGKNSLENFITLNCMISVMRAVRHVARMARMKNDYWLSNEEAEGMILFRNHLCKW